MSQPSPPAHIPTLSPAAGAFCGFLAAVGYAIANAALREATETDASLVSAVKPLPTVLVCGPMLLMMAWRGKPPASSYQKLPFLISGSIAGQLVGNLLFQISLGIIGLALSVPLCLSSMIIGGAILGKVILGDGMTRRTLVSIVVLIAASCVLSAGTSGNVTPVDAQGNTTDWLRMMFGVAAAFVSGIAFAYFSVTMRASLRHGMTVPLTMITSGIVGSLILWPIAVGSIGVAGIAATPSGQWTAMLMAGCCNTIAFFLLSFALRSISVLSVNLLNATQTALAALFGVLWFHEPLTLPLWIGSALTVIGLVILGTGGRKASLQHAESDSPSDSSSLAGSGSDPQPAPPENPAKRRVFA